MRTIHPLLRIATLLVCAGTAGCGAGRRHAVLDFFLDGVPPLTEASDDSTAGSPAEPADDDTKVPVIYEHPPVAEGLCELCHAVEGKTFAGNTDLVLPPTELCYECHDDLLPEPLRAEGKWLHGPFAAGQCIACHSPHKAIHPSLLRNASREEICARCHRERDLRPVEAAGHGVPGAPPCIDCHDPHYAESRFVARSAAAEAPGRPTEGGSP